MAQKNRVCCKTCVLQQTLLHIDTEAAAPIAIRLFSAQALLGFFHRFVSAHHLSAILALLDLPEDDTETRAFLQRKITQNSTARHLEALSGNHK